MVYIPIRNMLIKPAKGMVVSRLLLDMILNTIKEKKIDAVNNTRNVIVGKPKENAYKNKISPKPKLTLRNFLPLTNFVYKNRIATIAETNKILVNTTA